MLLSVGWRSPPEGTPPTGYFPPYGAWLDVGPAVNLVQITPFRRGGGGLLLHLGKEIAPSPAQAVNRALLES